MSYTRSMVFRAFAAAFIVLCLSTGISAEGDSESILTPDTLNYILLQTIRPTEGYINIGHFPAPYSAGDVEPSSVLINGSYNGEFVTISPYHPDFSGKVIRIGIYLQNFILSYDELWWDTTETAYSVTGYFKDGTSFSSEGTFMAIGHTSGDVNGDNLVNLGDAAYLINYIFRSGPEPHDPLLRADANGDFNVNIGDATYLINYIFRGGPPPVRH
ncbi:MAG: hypothetical protein KAR42_12785 [candidate division Zixibacteria bacterium]|nr:hypothetical protein [candidate division Zixibacteria bacterium]